MKIAVIGEKMIDRYHIGTADRLSPEAPIPVVKITQTVDLPGGAGNVAANLKALGVDVVEIYPYGPWPVKNRLMVGQTQLARWDEDDTVEPFSLRQFTPGGLVGVDGIVFSDYGKGAFPWGLPKDIAKLLPDVPVFIDTKDDPSKFFDFNGAIYFPNLKEYAQYKDSYDFLPSEQQVVLKMGAAGMRCGGYTAKALASSTVSVNGAGDTTIASYAVAWLRTTADGGTASVKACLEFASFAAAVVVQKPLTSTVTMGELEPYYAS